MQPRLSGASWLQTTVDDHFMPVRDVFAPFTAGLSLLETQKTRGARRLWNLHCMLT
jgi:hypothetical protein